MWHPRWYRTKVRCADQGFMPIYLTPPTYGGVFWQASGPKKVFSHFLVEYPAPEKSKNISQNLKETTVPVEADTTQ